MHIAHSSKCVYHEVMMTEERKKVISNVQYPKIGPKVSRNLVKILEKGHGKSS